MILPIYVGFINLEVMVYHSSIRLVNYLKFIFEAKIT